VNVKKIIICFYLIAPIVIFCEQVPEAVHENNAPASKSNALGVGFGIVTDTVSILHTGARIKSWALPNEKEKKDQQRVAAQLNMLIAEHKLIECLLEKVEMHEGIPRRCKGEANIYAVLAGKDALNALVNIGGVEKKPKTEEMPTAGEIIIGSLVIVLVASSVTLAAPLILPASTIIAIKTAAVAATAKVAAVTTATTAKAAAAVTAAAIATTETTVAVAGAIATGTVTEKSTELISTYYKTHEAMEILNDTGCALRTIAGVNTAIDLSMHIICTTEQQKLEQMKAKVEENKQRLREEKWKLKHKL
jgi:hypothetical protein